MEEENRFLELWRLFRKYLGYILLVTIIGGALSAGFMLVFVPSEYRSEAQLLINQQTSQEQIQTSDIQTNIQLINTYSDIILGQSVLEEVNNNMGGGYSIESLRNAIEVTQSPNSQAFYIRGTMETPRTAQELVNNVITAFESKVREIYEDEVSGIYVLSPASFNSKRISPSLVMYVGIGLAIGFIMAVGYIFLVEMLDTTVKDAEDLRRLGLTKLGETYELSNKEMRENRLQLGREKKAQRRV